MRQHFPGLVHITPTRYEPAWTWEHYRFGPDQRDPLGKSFDNKARRVEMELWVSYLWSTVLNSSDLFNLLVIMIESVVFECRISSGVSRAMMMMLRK